MTIVKRIVIFTGGVIMLAGCAGNSGSVEPKKLYKSDSAQKAAYESYDRTMELWDTAYEEEWVSSEYGETHVIISGPEEGPPVFLIPGLWGDASMWYPNAGELSRHFRVYTLDMINYAGKSVPSGKQITGVSDYAEWYTGLLRHFGYDSAPVVGVSYSSWLALALAREIPESISALALLDPASTFIKMDGGIAWKGFWSFGFFPNRQKYKDFFRWIGGGYSDPKSAIWEEHMFDVVEYGAVGMFDIPQPVIYTADDLQMVKMPVLLMVGGKPILYKDPSKFIEAAKLALPHADVDLVQETGHGLNMEKAGYVNGRISDFLSGLD